MDQSQLRHQSDSRFCFSLSQDTVLVRLGIARSAKIDTVRLVYGISHEFTYKRKKVRMQARYFDGTFDYYEAKMSGTPTRFLYFFEIENEGLKWCYSESGLHLGFDYGLGFLNAFQMIGENRSDFTLPKPSWDGRIFYQIFPERFAIGIENKPYVNRSWQAKGNELHGAFLGGDLRGIKQKLDYLSSLGVGAIYLNPIHPSPSNHKYDVLDYFDVDLGFGGMEAFDELIEEAHAHDIKIVMDLVFNHTSNHHPFFEDVKRRGRASPYYDFYFIDGDYPDETKKNYATFASVKTMPKLDTSNPKVQDYLIEVGRFYAGKHHVDGFRLDVCEGVSHEFWMRFKMELKKIDPEVLLIGEIWLNSESYLGPNQIDGVMDYPLLGTISGFCLGNDLASETSARMNGYLVRYKEGNVKMMMNLLSSHDIQRFTHLNQGDKDAVLIGYAILFFFPGFPCLYYGDEIFLDGATDPDSRRGMPWGSPEFNSPEHEAFLSLLRLRHSDDALKHGEVYVGEEHGCLRIMRWNEKETITLIANMSGKEVEINGKAILSRHYDGKELSHKGYCVFLSHKK